MQMSRTAAVALCIAMAAAVLGGCSRARPDKPPAPSKSTSTTRQTTTTAATTSTTETTVSPVTSPRIDDGSLGSQASRAACTLLSQAEIRSQFGGPVGAATPANPYCEWLVGHDAFLALDYLPNVPFAEMTRFTGSLVTLRHLGTRAEIGDNRYLYLSDGRNSFWLLWQEVGDFTSLHQRQLTALAEDVLAHGPPEARLAAPKPVPPGPPIYFAGDSTAAGPEWAWVTYHTGRPTLRTLAEYQVGSGLVVPQYFNWEKHLLAVAAEQRPKLVIYMGSANDDQPLPYEGGFAAVGSPGWRKVYGERVGAIMSELTHEGAKVLWIGEPAMQNPALSLAMLDVDEVCHAEASRHPGVTWFNPGTVLNLPGWRYTATLPIGGHEVSVRLDGVHLNTAGSIYLADKIAPVVDKLMGVP